MKRIIYFTIVFSLFTHLAYSQTLQTATESYNEGVKMLQEQNFEGAVQHFVKSYDIALSVEDEGAFDVQMNAKKQICETYLKIANAYYQKNDFRKAYENMNLAIENSEKYEEAATKQKAQNALPVLVYQLANTDLKNEKIDEAIEDFNKAIALNQNFDPAYIGLAIAYGKKNDTEKALAAYDKAIEIAQTNNKSQSVTQNKKSAFAYTTKLAQDLKNKNDMQNALFMFEKALGYDDSNPDVGYLAAETAGKLDNHAKVIEHAQKALEVEKREAEKGKILYVLASAYKALKQNDKACSTYKQLEKHATFKKNAEYELKQLKCN